MTLELKLIRLMAESLLAQAIQAGNHEVHPDGVWVHGSMCRSYCDYACGAIWIGCTIDADGQRTITGVQNPGTLHVEFPR